MLYKNLASVCPIYVKFLAKKFSNDNVVGNINFSILNVFFNSYFIHTFDFKFHSKIDF